MFDVAISLLLFACIPSPFEHQPVQILKESSRSVAEWNDAVIERFQLDLPDKQRRLLAAARTIESR